MSPALSDPDTGVPIVVTSGSSQYIEYGWGGTSLGCPIFSAFWAIANEKAGHPLGQAAPAIAALPRSGIQDVLPTTDSTQTTSPGRSELEWFHHVLRYPSLFRGALRQQGIYQRDLADRCGDVVDFGFGIDSSLTVKRGWDNATGYGTPYGLAFINAVTANAATAKK